MGIKNIELNRKASVFRIRSVSEVGWKIKKKVKIHLETQDIFFPLSLFSLLCMITRLEVRLAKRSIIKNKVLLETVVNELREGREVLSDRTKF